MYVFKWSDNADATLLHVSYSYFHCLHVKIYSDSNEPFNSIFQMNIKRILLL